MIHKVSAGATLSSSSLSSVGSTTWFGLPVFTFQAPHVSLHLSAVIVVPRIGGTTPASHGANRQQVVEYRRQHVVVQLRQLLLHKDIHAATA